TALAGSDYQTATGTLTFTPGQTQRTFQVNIVNNTTPEPTEQFSVVLSNPSGATIARGTGVVTIFDNAGALMAAREAPQGTPTANALSAGDVAVALDSAEASWARTGIDTSAFRAVTIVVVDLPGAALGETDGTAIRLDADAAGWGWATAAAPVA